MSSREALERVEEEHFALILLDVQMPGTDGLEAARLIKARERGAVVPILFITAQERDRRRVTTAYEAGAVDYLFKPLDPDELRAKVSEVRITDTGPGITPAEQTAIFEPYYRSERTAQLPGIGLGLAISQLLVAQMGGTLTLRSEPGHGASFTIRLPVAESAAHSHDVDVSTPTQPSPSGVDQVQ